jgi:MerR family transcriptional regulator, thiopeptide resistance regulator
MEENDKRWRIGELAEQSGLTVRTLHHFEEVGVLTASERSDAGHRLFTESDVRRLYAVLALRDLGLPLREIAKQLAEPDRDLSSTLERHRERVQEQLDFFRRLDDKLRRVSLAFERPTDVSTEDLLEVIGLMNMHEKYYTDEQLEQLAKRREEFGDEAIRKAEQDWVELIAAVDKERANGTDPKDPKVQELALRWRELIEAFTGGDPGIRASLQKMYEQEGTEKASRGTLKPEVMEYMNRAMS